jgi:hypothetical protein
VRRHPGINDRFEQGTLGARASSDNLFFESERRLKVTWREASCRGSRRGGETAAILFSFPSTCQRLGVEPWAYLHDVLTRLPATPAGQIGELLPDHWRAARQIKRGFSPEPATSTFPSSDEFPC